MNNVREAAERLLLFDREYKNGGNLNYAGSEQESLDLLTLANDYLPMLDSRPITPAALEALGFKVNYGIWSLSVASVRLQVIVDNDRVLVNIWDCGHECRTSITTIGQLRALIFALSPKGPADE